MSKRALSAVPNPDDDFSDLYGEIDSPPTQRKVLASWKPQDEGPGAEIKGRVIAVAEVDGNYGTKPVLTIDTPEGEQKVWASHSVLKSKLEESPPAPGSRILIRYDGTQTSAAGRDYHVYSVAVKPQLNVPRGRSWIDVFNGREAPSPSAVRDDDLPF